MEEKLLASFFASIKEALKAYAAPYVYVRMQFKELAAVLNGLAQYILLYLNDYIKILFPQIKGQGSLPAASSEQKPAGSQEEDLDLGDGFGNLFGDEEPAEKSGAAQPKKEEKPQEKVEEKKEEKKEAKKEEKKEEKPQANAEANAEAKPQEKAEEKAEEKPQEKKEEKPQEKKPAAAVLSSFFKKPNGFRPAHQSLSLDKVYTILETLLCSKEQLVAMVMQNADAGKELQALVAETNLSNIYSAFGRVGSFIGYAINKYPILEMAEAGLYNKSDILADVAHFADNLIKLEDFQNIKNNKQLMQNIKQMLPLNRMVQGKTTGNVPLDVTVNNIPYQEHLFADSQKKQQPLALLKSSEQFATSYLATLGADGSVNVWNTELALFRVISSFFGKDFQVAPPSPRLSLSPGLLLRVSAPPRLRARPPLTGSPARRANSTPSSRSWIPSCSPRTTTRASTSRRSTGSWSRFCWRSTGRLRSRLPTTRRFRS